MDIREMEDLSRSITVRTVAVDAHVTLITEAQPRAALARYVLRSTCGNDFIVDERFKGKTSARGAAVSTKGTTFSEDHVMVVVELVMKVPRIMSSFGSFGRMKNNTTHSPSYFLLLKKYYFLTRHHIVTVLKQKIAENSRDSKELEKSKMFTLNETSNYDVNSDGGDVTGVAAAQAQGRAAEARENCAHTLLRATSDANSSKEIQRFQRFAQSQRKTKFPGFALDPEQNGRTIHIKYVLRNLSTKLTRVHQYQAQISKLQLENESMRGQLRGLEAACAGEVHAALVARLATLETEHAALARDADAQRRQYERCLDDVANQVVRALLSQKGLREEIGALQRRIRELEAQNRALSGLLAQAANPGSPTELIQGILEAGPAAVVAALGLDPAWVPLSRPRSLNLQIPVMAATKCRRNRPLAQKPSEEEGSESPESGNRDEGYSTMSSDVQGEGARQEPSRGLEDLKEATDETEADVSPDARLVALDAGDPDVLFLPLNLTVGINPRHSYPPTKDLLPYQHVMRSFSDSHLCLKLTTTTNFTPYKLPSPMGSSSLLLVEEEGWDAEYVQQWLRLDDSRSAQQHRDLLELEYDKAELEDWSFSLSTEDLVQNESTVWKEPATTTTPALPAIKEHNPLELEEDANECLWNGASYLADRTGGELVALLMDARATGSWPYATSPGASWSSEEGAFENSSKRSSAALSGCSDDPDSPSIGTDFTRDFYRLVKFESTKSLASTSSRSGRPPPDREQALQSVLSFIAEQQMYLAELPNGLLEHNNATHAAEEETEHKDESGTEAMCAEIETSVDQDSGNIENVAETSSNDDLLDQIPVPSLAPEERIISAVACNGGVSYTTVAPSELGAVPEEDEEAATSSTPSTVVSPARAPLLVEGRDRSLSFHERATSKDVIDELNRMIRKGEENTVTQETQVPLEKLDLACCCPTGWVHVERDIDFTDPKARANLLDVMLESSESSSATSSSGSAGSDSGDEPPDYRHLHRLHRYRRQKKDGSSYAVCFDCHKKSYVVRLSDDQFL
ncbi:Nck-associated protein 5 [Melipona quadrifasciata]|uniref:Nck-associated protein 5 n=1 Tax=Melipona quadrifasciata TaxID=166423 RepID=A0A0M8ZS14_9HYME|nr:Nck-associated protein 5 [Melipona quadrifasciata]